MPELRDYQILACDTVECEFINGTFTQLVELPTGTGKTVVMGEIARRRLHLGRVVFVVHRQEIIRQTVDQMYRATGVTPGIVMAEQDDYAALIVCASIQTLARAERRERLLSVPVATVFVDECHHYTSASTYGQFIREIRALYPDALILGVSATPYRMDREDITQVFTPVFARTITRMQQEKWLADVLWRPVFIEDMKLAKIPTRTQDGERDYALSELAERMLPHAKEMASLSTDLIGDRSTVVFAVSIAHMHALVHAYRESGLDIHAVWGDMPKTDRAWTLNAWKNGDIQAVCNVGVLTEGYDFPGIQAIVMARPTQSPSLYTQMLGRGLRRLDDKNNCLVVEFTGTDSATEEISITLPDIVGEIEENDVIVGVPRATPTDRVFKRKSGVSLVAFDEFRVRIISVGTKLAYGIAESGETGLWDVIKIDSDNVTVISQRGWPEHQARQNLAVALENAHVSRTLFMDNSHWRKTDASEAQEKYLRSIMPQTAIRARTDGWKRGEVSDAITRYNYRGVIRRWRKRQGWERKGDQWISN